MCIYNFVFFQVYCMGTNDMSLKHGSPMQYVNNTKKSNEGLTKWRGMRVPCVTPRGMYPNTSEGLFLPPSKPIHNKGILLPPSRPEYSKRSSREDTYLTRKPCGASKTECGSPPYIRNGRCFFTLALQRTRASQAVLKRERLPYT